MARIRALGGVKTSWAAWPQARRESKVLHRFVPQVGLSVHFPGPRLGDAMFSAASAGSGLQLLQVIC